MDGCHPKCSQRRPVSQLAVKSIKLYTVHHGDYKPEIGPDRPTVSCENNQWNIGGGSLWTRSF